MAKVDFAQGERVWNSPAQLEELFGKPKISTKYEHIFHAVDKDVEARLNDKTEYPQGWNKDRNHHVARNPSADHVINANNPRFAVPRNQMEALFSGFPTYKDGSLPAAYNPYNDTVLLPPLHQFEGPEELYAAVFHELGHWTGHETRLNRRTLRTYEETSDKGEEELVAEMCAAYVTGALGIGRPEKRAHYIRKWFENLEEQGECDCGKCFTSMTRDETLKLFEKAKRLAKEAATYILSKAE